MRNKKGFSLVELLAAVVILGIIMMISLPAVSKWIDSSKKESNESMKKTLRIAAESYAQAHTETLPKSIGQTTTIQATELREAKFLKEDLVNANKKDCMSSYVKVTKKNNNSYKYNPVLSCEGDSVENAFALMNPEITIGFIGNTDGNANQNVSTSAFKVTIVGGSTGERTFKVDGYSYSLSARYGGTGEIVEIYNSGSILGNDKERIVIQKNISEYTDITTGTDFIVTVEAYNDEGGYTKKTADSAYKDNTAPTCGKITGQASVLSWIKDKGKSRTITVECSDNEGGSGCLKESFTKTFDTQMQFGYITIQDNAGNTTDCQVRVNIDWTEPGLTVNAYVKTDTGGKGELVASAHADSDNPYDSIQPTDYKYNVNGWLNKAHYPNGVYYEILTTDNILIDKGRWNYNPSGVFSTTANNYNVLTNGPITSFTVTNHKTNVSLSAEGLRKGVYALQDAATNEVHIDVFAKIDTTDPTCGTTKSNQGSTAGVNVAVSCTDYESRCSDSNQLSYTGQKASTSYTVSDNAGNTCSAPVSIEGRDCHCSDCYTGENTCKYGCDTCGDVCKGMKQWNGGYKHSCEMAGYKYIDSYSCNCSNCHSGHNTCKPGCDTCYW